MFKQDHSQINVWCRRIIISILVLAVVILSIFLYENYYHAKSPEVCHSSECLRSSAALKHHMDLRVDPCEDFYGYVCGKWAEENPRDEQSTHNSWFHKSQLKIYRNIRDHLEKNVSDADPKPVAQAKIMYRACLNKTARDQEGFKAVAKYLQELGLPTIPTMLNLSDSETAQSYQFDWVATVAKIKQKLGLDVLIKFDIENDHHEINRKSIILKIDDDLYHYYDSDKSPLAVQNSKSLGELINFFTPNLNESNYDQNLKTLGSILANFTLNFKRNSNATNINSTANVNSVTQDYYSVQELQNITDAFIGLDKPYPIWEHYLEELFAPYPTAKPSKEGKLYIPGLDYLKTLVKVVSKQPKQLIELYIWKRVVSLIVYHELDNPNTDDGCAKDVLVIMNPAVMYAINDKNFLDVTKPRVEQMLNNIRDEFNHIVLETDWMDADSKNATLDKSKSMDIFIGFPEWYMDARKLEEYYHGLQLEKDRYLENWLRITKIIPRKWLHTLVGQRNQNWNYDPTEVNAYYTNEENSIYLLYAFIQYPVYFLGLESLNYGALGRVIGHEITHGFDDRGRRHDKFGKMVHWWSNETVREYEKRANCFVEQYNRFYWKKAKEYINGTFTLNENIADNGGLREAFRAYQTYVKRHGPEPVLPGFESFTHEQLFFISYANHQCETLTPEHASNAFESDYHSPSEFRVKGVLRNMPEFSEAFQCPLGSPMNPAKKCRLW